MESFDLFNPGYSRCWHSSLRKICSARRQQGNVHVRVGPCQSFDCVPQTEHSFIHSLVFSLEGRAWQEPEPNHVTGMAVAHCILGMFLGLVCHCFLLPLDVPTLAARCLRPQ